MELVFELKAIISDPSTKGLYTAYIFNQDSKIIIPITMNRWACESILLAKQRLVLPRPHVHNTLARILHIVGAELLKVRVYKYLEDVFYTYLVIEHEGEIYEMDTKFSDGFSLCLLLNVPLVCSKEVYSLAGIKISKEMLDLEFSPDTTT